MFSVKRLSQYPQGVVVCPFQSSWYLDIYSKHFSHTDNVLLLDVYDNEEMVAWGAFEKVNDSVIFLGMKKVEENQEITDFGDITVLQPDADYPSVWTAICEYFKMQGITKIQLDYVKEDSETYQFFQTNPQSVITKQEVSPFITLPASWEEYLESLERTDRKELKRKLRRIETQPFKFIVQNTVTEAQFGEFIRLHRLSDSAKNKFMTNKMRNFFWDLSQAPKAGEWRTTFYFLTLNDVYAAAVFTFISDSKILMYNSGFDPSMGYYSVGLILKTMIIKRAIEDKKKIVDFLRGNERYKYDLGARNLGLFRLAIDIIL
ncbi:hypothetical protein COY90_05065 [Candidatus Roizmanbacteria bacterium CG_4_10_14_0_8_um_filter_39_9]|uniref:BioF2-like acetyltransferase domain-containing protein n=1 Tax=Candidatus Roizmanbacteria bacterium CG_4_10_14_0_8_um_filter_39_9 TaxID=1974829 RepID=A0A2M7QBK2_9BACT|nr:MAG: hypothetical protein COY90_05065 [Candidatus Roizmanbacteria bacterium CG_4_10_14_0_8_um_filter_39_9]